MDYAGAVKRPTAASLKKVTPENLAALGAERLAELLASAAEARPDLKRRLRMELAAEQGAEHLGAEIDRRLNTLETSRGKVSWRQRPTFVRDLDGLRGLITGRLAGLDATGALERMWRFMDLQRRLSTRVRDKDGSLAAVFDQAAGDVGALLRKAEEARAAAGLAGAIARHPANWTQWLPRVLQAAPPALAAGALRAISDRGGATAAWMPPIRQLADAAGDADAFAATFSKDALRTPSVAAAAASRLLAAGRVEEAGRALDGAKGAAGDADWEGVRIDYLEATGEREAAQSARWSAFERTLSLELARAFTRRLPEFEDVEAEGRAFEHAARWPEFARGLGFLMEWPALPEAARMIERRAGEAGGVGLQLAELWAGRLRARQPRAAAVLLRAAAAMAARRRDRETSERLTREADEIAPE